ELRIRIECDLERSDGGLIDRQLSVERREQVVEAHDRDEREVHGDETSERAKGQAKRVICGAEQADAVHERDEHPAHAANDARDESHDEHAESKADRARWDEARARSVVQRVQTEERERDGEEWRDESLSPTCDCRDADDGEDRDVEHEASIGSLCPLLERQRLADRYLTPTGRGPAAHHVDDRSACDDTETV